MKHSLFFIGQIFKRNNDNVISAVRDLEMNRFANRFEIIEDFEIRESQFLDFEKFQISGSICVSD